MLPKIVIILLFLIILYNLFAGLKELLAKEGNSEKLLRSLKWRIGTSVILFLAIILAFLTGFVQLHTL